MFNTFSIALNMLDCDVEPKSDGGGTTGLLYPQMV